MCRWIAYLGAPLRIDELPFRPQNSLIRQSLPARLGATTSREHCHPFRLDNAEGGEVEVGDGEVRMRPGRGSILVMSEPLDAHDEAWREVPPGHVLETRGGVARVSALAAA